eukprot:12216862-Ditylum_brightwellii.AAC.1
MDAFVPNIKFHTFLKVRECSIHGQISFDKECTEQTSRHLPSWSRQDSAEDDGQVNHLSLWRVRHRGTWH